MSKSVSIPKGTRDFTPLEMAKRNHIFNNLREVFKKFGYQPIETPALENLSILLGKYGDEGDKLLFRILNSGDFLKNLNIDNPSDITTENLISKISEKGLRYDLTVPFARFVVQNQNEIYFPFKRYQIQPVWRADRPQKGRYREFFQCDIDVIGSDSLLYEVEMIKIADAVFDNLNVNVDILINNRKILSGIAEVINQKDKIIAITTAIDKLDKIGIDNVIEELKSKGLSDNDVNVLKPILFVEGNNNDKIEKLSELLKNSEIGMKGLNEIKKVLEYLENIPTKSNVCLDITLARGLNYYTGAILEVKAKDVSIGSISGGGRYDNLTGIFGLDNMSGVGISFGADRIYDVMTELNLFNDIDLETSSILIINFGDESEKISLKTLYSLHNSGFSAEIYPDNSKLKKQFSYANSKNIKYVVMIGEEEIKNNICQIKEMKTGNQVSISLTEICDWFSKNL